MLYEIIIKEIILILPMFIQAVSVCGKKATKNKKMRKKTLKNAKVVKVKYIKYFDSDTAVVVGFEAEFVVESKSIVGSSSTGLPYLSPFPQLRS